MADSDRRMEGSEEAFVVKFLKEGPHKCVSTWMGNDEKIL